MVMWLANTSPFARLQSREKKLLPSINVASELFMSVTCDGQLEVGERKEVNNAGELNKYSKHK